MKEYNIEITIKKNGDQYWFYQGNKPFEQINFLVDGKKKYLSAEEFEELLDRNSKTKVSIGWEK